jgi:anaerobic magnesium-protoporphyrin IX monomethyl ester cyclase
MKVLLVNCVINLEGWRGEIYHQGLGYIIAVLKQHNHGVEGMPLTNERDILSFYDKVRAERPDVIGFSTTTNQFQYLKEIIPAVRKASPGSFLVCGGVHPTFQPDCIQDIPELDAIVRGEGEFPMLELVEAIKGKRDFHPIQNLSYRNGNGVVHNEIRPLIGDLDSLP